MIFNSLKAILLWVMYITLICLYIRTLSNDTLPFRNRIEKFYCIVTLGFLVFSFMLIPLIAFLVFPSSGDTALFTYYGESLGYLCTFVVIWQWSPQIVRVYLDKSSGNLSIVMVAIFTPASFLIGLHLLLLSNQNYTTCISYFVSGIQQLILLILCVYYSIKVHTPLIHTNNLLENLDSKIESESDKSE